MNANRPSVASAGLASGSDTDQKIRHDPAPSNPRGVLQLARHGAEVLPHVAIGDSIERPGCGQPEYEAYAPRR
jgi:hypothetical protein